MAASRIRGALLWFSLFALIGSVFVAGVLAIEPLFRSLARKMPENYRHQVREQIDRQKFAEAERLLQRRLAQEYYDFEARFLLAEVQASAGKPADAAETMVDTLQKRLAIRGRDIRAAGYDEPAMYQLLGRYLWQAKRYLDAGEMLRAAVDSGASKSSVLDVVATTSTALSAVESRAKLAIKLQDRVMLQNELQNLAGNPDERAYITRAILSVQAAEIAFRDARQTLDALVTAAAQFTTSPLILAAIKNAKQRGGVNVDQDSSFTITADTAASTTLDLDRFSLPDGARRTTDSLQLSRTSSSIARFDTGVFRTTSLLIRASGSEALGMSPILVLKSGASELARLYLDGLQPREYDILLWPNGAPKSLPLELVFENDASDTITKADRNIDVYELALH